MGGAFAGGAGAEGRAAGGGMPGTGAPGGMSTGETKAWQAAGALQRGMGGGARLKSAFAKMDSKEKAAGAPIGKALEEKGIKPSLPMRIAERLESKGKPGLSAVSPLGSNGTSHSFLQSAHVALCISLGELSYLLSLYIFICYQHTLAFYLILRKPPLSHQLNLIISFSAKNSHSCLSPVAAQMFFCVVYKTFHPLQQMGVYSCAKRMSYFGIYKVNSSYLLIYIRRIRGIANYGVATQLRTFVRNRKAIP